MSTENICWTKKIAEEGFGKSRENIGGAFKCYADKICSGLNPFHSKDEVFILAALKSITKDMAANNPMADAISELVLMEFTAFGIGVPAETPQKEVDRLMGLLKESILSNMKN